MITGHDTFSLYFSDKYFDVPEDGRGKIAVQEQQLLSRGGKKTLMEWLRKSLKGDTN